MWQKLFGSTVAREEGLLVGNSQGSIMHFQGSEILTIGRFWKSPGSLGVLLSYYGIGMGALFSCFLGQETINIIVLGY